MPTSRRPRSTSSTASQRNSWFYFTENELTPGAVRVGNCKAVFNLRGDDGMETGGLAVDTNLGCKLQSEVYTGPITLSQYQRFKHVREQLEREGVKIPLPTGN